MAADVSGIADGPGDAQVKLPRTERIDLVVRRHMSRWSLLRHRQVRSRGHASVVCGNRDPIWLLVDTGKKVVWALQVRGLMSILFSHVAAHLIVLSHNHTRSPGCVRTCRRTCVVSGGDLLPRALRKTELLKHGRRVPVEGLLGEALPIVFVDGQGFDPERFPSGRFPIQVTFVSSD